MRSRPDVLVLGVGGVLGEAWMMGVLAGIDEATGFDMRRCEYFVGTSAGSIVAAKLAAGQAPERPAVAAPETERAGPDSSADGATSIAVEAARFAGGLATVAGAPLVSAMMSIATPGSAIARAVVLRRLPTPGQTLERLRREIESSGARFDGRLRVVAVDRRSGRRAVFGSPGGPRATVGEAVEASCAVPWLFAPVTIGGREYVDGGVWSPTNLDVAPAGRDTQVLCLSITAGMDGMSTLVGVARNVARSALSLETLVVRGRGSVVRTIAPDDACAAAIGVNLMDRERRDRVLAAGYRQGLSAAAR